MSAIARGILKSIPVGTTSGKGPLNPMQVATRSGVDIVSQCIICGAGTTIRIGTNTMIRSLRPQALRPWLCRASRRTAACGRIASRVDPAPTLRATQRYLGSVQSALVRQVTRRQAHHSAVVDVDTVIRGGTVVTTSGVSRADVAISNGKIVGTTPTAAPDPTHGAPDGTPLRS
jgi:hypothetical protein